MTFRETAVPESTGWRAPVGTFLLFAAGTDAGYARHVDTFGPLDVDSVGPELISVLEASGLTGRGGAAFASWRKMAATAQSRPAGILAPRPVVIGNGAEGEPLSFKDKTLLAEAPHLVIDGLLAAARAVGGSQLYLYAGPSNFPALERAISERPAARGIRLAEAPDRFIAGEASAAVNAIATGSALPFDKRRRLSESGLKNRPTLVLNVETLAHIALIARYGAAWFRSVGSAVDPGTRLISVSGPGPDQVLEVAGNVSLGEVLYLSQIDMANVTAVLVGGYHGRWVKPLDYKLSISGPASHVVRPGAGVFHVLPAGYCGLETTAGIVDYLAGESARQCGPCMFGLPAMAGVLNRIAYRERDPRLVRELERLGRLVAGRGACHHPDGTIQLIGSALDVFSDEIKAHLAGTCTTVNGRAA
ncbi:NADH-ubiquinone oxidoreductase-F iron-sulfur binding region domain-containing protein [Arthrobacter sp. Y81]|uniref:NADH-ubiquinone oxidoreductase-F iron-sulfur binding region domain-containing protein n=1 Tax=Arthrobacter sp. Y81 TaxID=2058897 RepID=UPI000CE5455E|nr:NADH-ubiquinone oxidoreductase-F iron-sulfur binding region domain-containing protein [Arthrobacter sp. Y81]